MNDSKNDIPSIEVLGVHVHMVEVREAVNLIASWIKQRGPFRHVVNTGMHGLMEGCRDAEFKKILNSADLFTADGFSVAWLGRRNGFPLKKRVPGVELMREFFRVSEQMGFLNFFYGDTNETLRLMEAQLKKEFPRLKVAGTHSPPFRPLTSEESELELQMINDSGADIVWVGLGLPKQEWWISNNQSKLKVPVAVGVGASFKFLAGSVRRAPTWVGDNGLEWIWRLIHEPRRVWRRAVLDAPRFVIYLILERTGLKSFRKP